MKAVIKVCYSPDVEELFEYQPIQPDCFGFLVRFLIGPKETPIEESFDFFLCTPMYLLKSNPKDSVIFGRHLVIVQEYNFDHILDVMAKKITSIEEDNWELLADKISRIGKSEFEDYQPFKGII